MDISDVLSFIQDLYFVKLYLSLEEGLDDLQVGGTLEPVLALGNISVLATVLSCGNELAGPQLGPLLIDQTHDALQLLVVVPSQELQVTDPRLSFSLTFQCWQRR